jgi:CDP-diacylglycerol---glycerol-3-phosphate 3-phosphatidyltransferase
MANLVVLARVLLLFVVVGAWARKTHLDLWWIDLLMVGLLGLVIFLDAVDGWVARRRNEVSDIGALLDIAGDRIVELVLWVFFAIRQHPDGTPFVPYWVPVVIIARTVITDLIRSVAFQKGKTPFGQKSMMESGWARQLTATRWSRAVYGVLKVVAFCSLGFVLGLERMGQTGALMHAVRLVTEILVYATAIVCVVRAVPVVWDGRRYFEAPPMKSD